MKLIAEGITSFSFVSGIIFNLIQAVSFVDKFLIDLF